MIEGRMDQMQWFGNLVAYEFASECASRVLLPVQPRANIAVVDAASRVIITRLVSIETHCALEFAQVKQTR